MGLDPAPRASIQRRGPRCIREVAFQGVRGGGSPTGYVTNVEIARYTPYVGVPLECGERNGFQGFDIEKGHEPDVGVALASLFASGIARTRHGL